MFVKISFFLILLLVLIAIRSTKKIFLKGIIFICALIFLFLQISSIYVGGSFIDYKFFIHFNFRDIWLMKEFYSTKFFMLSLGFVFLSSLIWFIERRISFLSIFKNRYLKWIIILISIFFFSLKDGVFYNLFDAYRILYSKKISFEKALIELGLNSYVMPNDIKANKGKNIIIISLESYEKGLLSKNKKHISPYLQSLKNDWNYYNMIQTEGSEWTVGALYTLLTGLPAYFQGNYNKVFQGTTESKITSLGHVLNRANYENYFLIGNAEFAGTEDLLKTFCFNQIIDKRNTLENYEIEAEWGLHDKDLFNEAKNTLQKRINHEKPFCLYISTVSTHGPDGVYDKRFTPFIEKQNNNLEFMYAALDFLIKDFILFLKKNDLLNNTVVYILPDHLFMGKTSVLNDTGERGLFVITNAEENNISFSKNNYIYQLDLPEFILQGAKVSHNAIFLSTSIESNKENFIKKNKDKISALNSASLIRPFVLTNFIKFKLNQYGSIIVEVDGYSKIIDSNLSSNEVINIAFDEQNRLISIHKMKKGGLLHNPFLNFELSLKNRIITIETKKGDETLFIRKNKNELILKNCELKSHLEPSKKPFFINREYFLPTNLKLNKNVSNYYIKIPFTLTKGFLRFNTEDSSYINSIFLKDFHKGHMSNVKISKRKSKNNRFIDVFFYQTIKNPTICIKDIRKKDFDKINNIRLLGIGYQNESWLKQKSLNFNLLKNDTNRFIAHAGGIIDGHTYTNSLEALNKNYQRGFRLFELDIIKTSDNKYVAAHDWEMWAQMTAYNGILPPSEKVFLEHKILKKYSPLNMQAINDWFDNHRDAFLVTDKINEPKLFSSQFTDKSRLKMELFSIEALVKGVQTGIYSAMPSDNVLYDLGKNRIEVLRYLGIKHVILSRTMIQSNLKLLKDFQKNNIKVYVYLLDKDDGKDEKYVVKHEMDYIYGIYADEWHF